MRDALNRMVVLIINAVAGVAIRKLKRTPRKSPKCFMRPYCELAAAMKRPAQKRNCPIRTDRIQKSIEYSRLMRSDPIHMNGAQNNATIAVVNIPANVVTIASAIGFDGVGVNFDA